MVMAIRAAEAACASAWRTYLLLHKDVDEDDDRLSDPHVLPTPHLVNCER